MSEAELDGLVAEATVDCYHDDEQLYGLYMVIVDNLTLPFRTRVLGVDVTVDSVDLADPGHVVAVCRRGPEQQAIPILGLLMPTGRCGVDRGLPAVGELRSHS
jgi:hypothetical protein